MEERQAGRDECEKVFLTEDDLRHSYSDPGGSANTYRLGNGRLLNCSCSSPAPQTRADAEGSGGADKPESLVKSQGPGRHEGAWRDLQNFGVHLSV